MTKRALGFLVLIFYATEGSALAQGIPTITASTPDTGDSSGAVSLPPQQREPESLPASGPGVWARPGAPASPAPQASPAASRPALTATRHRAWYGWQLLAADSISLPFIGLGYALDSEDVSRQLIYTGALAYALVPPIIHLVHGRPGIATASLSVRVVLPVAGMFFGNATQVCTSEVGFCAGPGMTAGFVLGVALASAIDSTLFAWDKPGTALLEANSLGVAPVLSPDGKRFELCAFGTF